MINVRYLIHAADERNEERTLWLLGALPFVPQDYDSTTVIHIGTLQFYAVDCIMRNRSQNVDLTVMLYSTDEHVSEEFLSVLQREGWQFLKEGA